MHPSSRTPLRKVWQLRALLAAALIWAGPTLACGSFAPRPTPTPTLPPTAPAVVAPLTTPHDRVVEVATPVAPDAGELSVGVAGAVQLPDQVIHIGADQSVFPSA